MTSLYSQNSVVASTDQIAIMDGRMFRSYVRLTVPAAPATPGTISKFLLIKTPTDKTTVFHGRYLDSLGAKLEVFVYSNPVFSATGTEVFNKFNLNALRSNTTTAQFFLDPTFSSKGVEHDIVILPGGTQGHNISGSKDVADFQRVLAGNTYFLVEFKNIDQANSADVLYKLIWEEINI